LTALEHGEVRLGDAEACRRLDLAEALREARGAEIAALHGVSDAFTAM
jgi:hypothetical protein